MRLRNTITAATLAACLGAGSCGGGKADGGKDAATTDDDAAGLVDGLAAISGKRFRSLSMLDCGASLANDGTVLCYWHVDFSRDGTFYWQHADRGERGTYACDGNDVTGTGDGGAVTGRWDPKSARLSWADQGYALETALAP